MIRVFPRRTKWTPTDELAFIGDPPLYLPEQQPVKISVAFTWDIEEGKRLFRAWSNYYSDVQIGGPAFGDSGVEFTPGMFLKEGVTITSRGCLRACPFCFVPQREGKIREYAIKDGWILQDNNILACSKDHQLKVFEMLRRQKKAIDFNGGLDPRLLLPWQIDEFAKLKVRHFWFSSDLTGSEKVLEKTAELMSDYPAWKKRCYVLIGFNSETPLEAEKRLERVYELGFLPFAQRYQGEKKVAWSKDWDRLQRKWCRSAAYRQKNQGVNLCASD